MKTTNWKRLAAVLAVHVLVAAPSRGALFKIDFGHMENEREPLDADGNPVLDANGNPLGIPANLLDWTVLATWTFADPNALVTPDSASAMGTANAEGTAVTWTLIDSSVPAKTGVTITIFDNIPLAESLSPDAPPYMLGQTANNPTKEGIDVFYDGVRVPYLVKDDYLYRAPDTAGSESLMRIANRDPGTYLVTVFEGRTTDGNGRFGKIWVDDLTGAAAPTAQNTGNYSGVADDGTIIYKGQPRTVTVTLKAGEYLWFAEMEDNSGGISGMIIRSADPVDSPGLFKIDFGHMENEREPLGPDGNPLAAATDPDLTPVGPPPVLQDWNVIPTWTFADPNATVTEGSASLKGEANAEGTQVTWKLKDFSRDGNTAVTMTIMDNIPLAESLSPDAPPYMLGQTANNPTREGIAVVYDGVLVPAVVKDDYLYRAPDTAGTESLMRFAGLKPGKYNVTVFEGRTTDSGRFGKVWVSDIHGANEPATENTGSYSGVDNQGTVLPFGQPRTVTVDINAGEYLWFAEMEDNSGGISGMIIRGIRSSTQTPPALSIARDGANVKITFDGVLESRAAVGTGTWAQVAGSGSVTIPASQLSSAQFYRARRP